ncbi:MAG: hypothetical protein H5T64_02110 [Chloroflexi bacterium]|nr:hypothetical protein [Chloroflexota bacterium]
MAESWQLIVRTPEGILLEVSTSWVHAELINGGISIYPRHAPLIGETMAGPLRYRAEDGNERSIWLQPGILRVERGRVTVLTPGPLTEGVSTQPSRSTGET